MEFVIKTDKDGERTDFYMPHDECPDMPVITVYHNITPDFKSKRTARMIERMENIFKNANRLSNFALPKNLENGLGDSIKALTEDCHYIEHGDEPEAKFVRVFKLSKKIIHADLGETIELTSYDIPMIHAKGLDLVE